MSGKASIFRRGNFDAACISGVWSGISLKGNMFGYMPYTKRVRYSHLSSFFNFVRNNIDHDSGNPCDTPMIRKLYKERAASRWEIIEKETIDEIIFRTTATRNRLMLDLMARGGMRIGEVLKLRQKVILRHANLQTTQLYLQDSLPL